MLGESAIWTSPPAKSGTGLDLREGASHGGKEIWFTAAEASIDSALYAVDPSGKLRLALRIPGALHLHDIALDGRMLLSLEDQRTGILFLKDKEVRDLSWRT